MTLFFEDELPEDVHSRYEAVVIASRRARELQMGVRPLVEGTDDQKLTTIALRELVERKLAYEFRDPLEEAKK